MSSVVESVASVLPSGPAQKIGNKRIRITPRVSLGEITPNNVGTLKKLNLGLFPVAYSDRFYNDLLKPEVEDYCKLVFYQDLAVGCIVCRLEPSSTIIPVTLSSSISPTLSAIASSSSAPKVFTSGSLSEPHKLYIMTVGVLAPYRRQGLASKLVQQVISAAEATHRPPVADVYPIKAKEGDKKKGAASTVAAAKKAIVTELYLHVQTSNDESRLFWEGHGFQVTGTVKDYYRKIEPRDAWLLKRDIVA